MLIIVSIHQPNNDLFHQFDNVYVLSKDGHHIYSGPPHDLVHHLRRSEIDCSQSYPIETLLRIASNSYEKDNDVKRLSKINNIAKDEILRTCLEEAIVSNGIVKQHVKKFSFKDFWNLMIRNMICSYIYEWKSILMQMILYLLLAINLSNLYNKDIALIDGCVDKKLFMLGQSCNDTEDSLIEESKLKQNIQYNISFLTGTSFIQIIITTLTFTSKVNIFLNEHRNGKIYENYNY